jgi:hypothetical protein
MKRHGRVATTWVRIKAVLRGTRRETEWNVWWFPSTDTFKVSARDSGWGVEQPST